MSNKMQGMTQYPSEAAQSITFVIGLIAICWSSVMLSRRIPPTISSVTITRISILFIFFDSWIFLFSSATVQFGVGSSFSDAACNVQMQLCTLFYFGAKVGTTFFLIERVHIVLGKGVDRLKSNLYRGNLLIMGLWGLLAIAAFSTERALFKDDRVCAFAIPQYASALALVLDFTSSTYLGLLFVIPLSLNRFDSAVLKRLAFRSAIATVIATLSSLVNLTITVALHHESSWICTLACVIDTAICSTAIFFVTSQNEEESNSQKSQSTLVQPKISALLANNKFPITVPDSIYSSSKSNLFSSSADTLVRTESIKSVGSCQKSDMRED